MINKKYILILLILSLFCMQAFTEGNEYGTLRLDNIKIIMHYPAENTSWKDINKAGWTGTICTNSNLNMKIAVFASKKKLNNDDIIKFGIKEIGIKVQNWIKIDKDYEKNGIRWYELYVAKDSKNGGFIIIGKNAKHDIWYLIFFTSQLSDFLGNIDDFIYLYKNTNGIE